MTNVLSEQFASFTDAEIDRIVNDDFNDYTDSAITIAREEAKRRGLEVRPRAKTEAETLAVIRILPVTRLPAMVVLQVVTLGLYLLYWLFRRWSVLRKNYGEKISPFWRTVFAPLFIYDLFAEVRRNAAKLGVPSRWPPALLT
jgi:hypothetical protein